MTTAERRQLRERRERRLPPLFLLFLLFHPLRLYADGAGTNSAEFLRLGSGAPASMSEAGGSVSIDPTALHWNPAGPAASDRLSLYASHASMPETLSNDYLGVSVPVRDGTLAGTLSYSMQLLRQGTLDKVDNTGTAQGTFSAMDQAHTLGWAGKRDDLRYGASLSFISQTIDGTSGSSYALGLGAQKDLGAFKTGVSLTNLGPGLKLGSTSSPLPMTLRGGGSWLGFQNDLLLASDLSYSTGRNARLHVGAGYRVYPTHDEDDTPAADSAVFLRAGYMTGQTDSSGPNGLSAGIGMDVGPLHADAMFQPFGQFGNVIQLGLGWSFGRGEQRRLATEAPTPPLSAAPRPTGEEKVIAPAPAPPPPSREERIAQALEQQIRAKADGDGLSQIRDKKLKRTWHIKFLKADKEQVKILDDKFASATAEFETADKLHSLDVQYVLIKQDDGSYLKGRATILAVDGESRLASGPQDPQDTQDAPSDNE